MRRTSACSVLAVVSQWMSGVPRFHLSILSILGSGKAEACVLCPEFEHQRSWSHWWPSTLVDCPTFKIQIVLVGGRARAIPRMPKCGSLAVDSWTAGSIR